MTVENEMRAFYNEGRELDRLVKGIGPLEFARTKDLIARYIPPPPGTIFDVGGAHGTYSFWLAGLGYRVHLVDVVPLHIEHAARTASDPASPQLASMRVGDARHLDFPDESADVVILHGPLYHLTKRPDRIAALSEVRRVLRPDGVLLAFTITPYASMIVGITRGWVLDSDYLLMCKTEIDTGDHVRPASWPSLFASAYFHHPRHLGNELKEAGFACEGVFGVEGPGWMVPDFQTRWTDDTAREAITSVARCTEHEPVLSPHNMAVARKREAL